MRHCANVLSGALIPILQRTPLHPVVRGCGRWRQGRHAVTVWACRCIKRAG